jgi:flagellar biosynthesis chaperone FliJ
MRYSFASTKKNKQMEVLDQVKEKVENIVTEVKSNVTDVQVKAEEQYNKFIENYKVAVDKLKGEYTQQATTFQGFKERIAAKASKHKKFDAAAITADIKEEVELFTSELKSGVERLRTSFKK